MIYRIDARLNFPTRDIPDGLVDKVKQLFSHAITVKPGQPEEETSFIILERCYHDESPTQPCQELARLESH